MPPGSLRLDLQQYRKKRICDDPVPRDVQPAGPCSVTVPTIILVTAGLTWLAAAWCWAGERVRSRFRLGKPVQVAGY
jgi:hypothetical protein